ncbi:uncharacterized protein LOC125029911 [Penaeus chinensis]|uniref:uncharacterized protein LOC125029910 n=1 Tax=Penaeus chinensis TaxID=139456 RepID=UPI001FB735D4|nr:uncharacterized protein LOC125029910 [Penaeus chinensis]XP_047476054.1 uncharacterized protein LOC125029911 [Penaeus chinensis]
MAHTATGVDGRSFVPCLRGLFRLRYDQESAEVSEVPDGRFPRASRSQAEQIKMRAIFFLALAALAAAEPSQSKVNIVNEPQDGDVHNRVKRELTGDPDGHGPYINVDMEINAGPHAHVAVDVDVNIGQ